MDDWLILTMEYLARALAILVAWLLVVLGWLVVNDLSVQRERLKIELDKLKELRSDIERMEELAIGHHTQGFDEARLRQLSRKIKLVGMEFSHLERAKVIGTGWRELNAKFRRSATGFNFGSVPYRKYSLYDSEVVEIYQGCDQLRGFLYRVHEHKFDSKDSLRSTLRKMWRRF